MGSEILLVLLSWLILAVVAGIGVLMVRAFYPPPDRRLFPPQRHLAVAWSLAHLGLVLIVYVLWEWLFIQLFGLRGTDLPNAINLRMAAHTAAASGLEAGIGTVIAGLVAAEISHQLDLANQANLQIWVMVIGHPLIVVSIVLATVYIAGAPWYQLRLTTHRLGQTVTAAYLVWLVATPLVFGIYWLAQGYAAGGQHAIEVLLQLRGNDLLPWVLACLGALVLAPALEELLFRGLIQPLLVRQPQIADLVLLGALIWAIVVGFTKGVSWNELDSWWPIFFLVGVGGGYILFEAAARPILSRPGVARAIFASSLLFAAMHATVWPTPIPLFFLSLAIGFVAYRTQSLVGPLLIHSLFNGVSLVQMVLARTVGA